MDSNDFELETKFRNLTLEQENVSTNEREQRLAALIATCVADVEPNDQQENETDVSKENDQPTSLIVTNLPQTLFAEQSLKVTIYMWLSLFNIF